MSGGIQWLVDQDDWQHGVVFARGIEPEELGVRMGSTPGSVVSPITDTEAWNMVLVPPDAEGGRRVRVDGEILGRATGPGDLLEFLRRAGLDPDDIRLDDPLLIEWRGGGPPSGAPTAASSELGGAGPARVVRISENGSDRSSVTVTPEGGPRPGQRGTDPLSISNQRCS
ncbi:hypothetical protein ACFWIB_35795 [Streptomyces sp. NPDC127051]|uniref:hypothetical protein n=1 Tax=Streptomyces sp. NPDC127051 TaxID=3347119 RepID=UPI0036481A62